jgi:RNA polymerase sigma factor (sigma-70 family)
VDQTVSAAIAGDEPAFAALTERHRRELHVHCYRMLASFDEAEDAVQETFLKAWRGLPGFDGGSQFRAWLYRRATMQAHLPARRADWSAREPTASERELLERFIEAHERFDAEAAMAIAAQDIRITMPPLPYRYDGPDQIRPLLADAAAMGEWRLIPVGANWMPAAASYLRRPGDSEFRAFKLDVMRIEAGRIAEITTFNAGLFAAFGLEPTL